MPMAGVLGWKRGWCVVCLSNDVPAVCVARIFHFHFWWYGKCVEVVVCGVFV